MNGDMKYAPIVTDWQLFFKKSDGQFNRLEVVREFSDFWHDPNRMQLDLRTKGKCLIGGKVYGHKALDDDTMIFTSYLKTITKIHSLSMMTTPCAMLRAETDSGSIYFMAYDSYNAHMKSMLEDIEGSGELEEYPGRYLDQAFKKLRIPLKYQKAPAKSGGFSHV